MSIRTRILAIVLTVTMLGVIIGITGFVSVQMISAQTKELHKYSAQSDTFTTILSGHYAWRNGLTHTVLTGEDFTGSLDPAGCALGRWMNSEEAANITDPMLKDLLSKVVTPHRHIHTNAQNVIDLVEAGDMDGAIDEFNHNILPSFDEVIAILTAISARYSELVAQNDEDVTNIENMAIIVIAIMVVIAFAVSVILAINLAKMFTTLLIPMSKFFTKAGAKGDIIIDPEDFPIIARYAPRKDELGSLTRGAAGLLEHLGKVNGTLSAIAAGDLSADVDVLSDQDTLGQSLKQMTDNLNDMFGDINIASEQVSVGAKHIAEGSQSLAQGSTEQASSVEELSASISEVAAQTKENAEMAERAAKLANTIMSNAEKGNRQMDEMMAAVKEINAASSEISKVIKVIDDIAFQTNILALNAAVEAARAGQHGKGFAVVAEEVRNLAAKSADAAKDTGGLIANSMEKAELGNRIAGETAESLSEIVQGISESSELITQIADSSDKQSANIGQINVGIDQVAQVIQQNSATAQQSAAASQEMSGQSDTLQELVERFKLRDSAASKKALPSGGARAQAPAQDEGAFDGDLGKY